MRMSAAVWRGRKAARWTIGHAAALFWGWCVLTTQVGAFGLVVGSVSFLIVSDGWWNYLWELPGDVVGVSLLVEHRSVADGARNRFGVPILPDRTMTPGEW